MPAKSKSQQRFFSMVHAYQRGELKDAPESVKKAARSMSKKEAKKYASTPRKNLPEAYRINAYTLDQLKQELRDVKREYKLAIQTGEDQDVIDDFLQDIAELEDAIDDKRIAMANEQHKALSFKDFLIVETLIAQADEWRVEQDEDGLVHLIDGEQTIRATMTSQIWQALCARSGGNTGASMHEGVFGAARSGAAFARSMGSHVAKGIADTMKSSVSAGRTGSLEKRAVMFAVDAAKKIKQIGPGAHKALMKVLGQMGEEGKLGLELYLQGGKLAVPTPKEEPKLPQDQNNVDMVPAAMRAQGKPRMVQAKGRPAGEFSYAWPGRTESVDIPDEVINEAIGAFLKGVGKHVAKKASKRMERNLPPSFKAGAEMWAAGKESSARATVLKIAQQLVKYAEALKQLQQQRA